MYRTTKNPGQISGLNESQWKGLTEKDSKHSSVSTWFMNNVVKQTWRLNPCEVLTLTPSSDKSEQLSMED